MCERSRPRKKRNSPEFLPSRAKPPPEVPLPAERVIWYTAGFIDGEGSVVWSKGKRPGQRRCIVTVCQTEPNHGKEVLEGLRDAWGIGTVRRYRQGQSGRYAPVYRWSVGAREEILHLLRALLPALQVKHAAAADAIALLELRPKSQPPMVTAVCAECGSSFERRRARFRLDKRRYCSVDCRNKATGRRKRRRVELTCSHCNSVFEKRPGDKRAQTPFCSKDCYLEYLRVHGFRELRKKPRKGKKTVTCICGFCGATFQKQPSQIQPSGLVFCSRSCTGKARTKEGRSRTTCKHGHPIDAATAYRRSNGTLECRICRIAGSERYVEARRRKRQTQAQQSWDW